MDSRKYWQSLTTIERYQHFEFVEHKLCKDFFQFCLRSQTAIFYARHYFLRIAEQELISFDNVIILYAVCMHIAIKLFEPRYANLSMLSKYFGASCTIENLQKLQLHILTQLHWNLYLMRSSCEKIVLIDENNYTKFPSLDVSRLFELRHGSYGKIYRLPSDCSCFASCILKRCTGEWETVNEDPIAPATLREVASLIYCRDLHYVIPLYALSTYYDDVRLIEKDGACAISQLHKPIREPIMLMAQLMFGLYELHSQHILHRDIGINNIVVDRAHHPYFIDFGLSRLLIDDDLLILLQCLESIVETVVTDVCLPIYRHSQKTTLSTQSTTLWFRAPEILFGRTYSYAADIWSLGVVFYYIITGENLFAFSEMPDGIAALKTKMHTFETKSNVEFNDWVKKNGLIGDLISRMLEVDPMKRISITEACHHAVFGSGC